MNTLTLLLALALVAPPSGASQSPADQVATELALNLVSVAPVDVSVAQLNQYISASVRSDMLDRRVVMKATHTPSQTVGMAEHATSYFPTALWPISDLEFVVAGKNPRGFTVIELWTLDGYVTTQVVQGQPSGGTGIAVKLPRVASRDLICMSDAPDLDTVRLLIPNRGSSREVFVLFNSSRDLWSLNVDTQQAFLRATPAVSPPPPALSAPTLASMSMYQWSAQHVTEGFVIGIVDNDRDATLFIDADMDGVLDATHFVDADSWSGSIFADASDYVE